MGDSTSRAYAFSTVRELPPTQYLQDGQTLECASDPSRDLWSWVDEVTAERNPIVDPVCNHLYRARHIASVLVPSEQSSGEQRRLLIGDELVSWGHAANVLWITEDRSVFDQEGRLLLDHEGRGPDQDAVIPCPADARQRKAEVEVRLRNRMVDPPPGLLPLPGADELQMVEPADVARRALALFLCATRAESLLVDQPLDVQRMIERCPIGFEALTAQERLFFGLSETELSQQQLLHIATDFVWRYESLMTLQWALDMQFELPWPDERADLTAVTRLMIDLPDESIVEHARLRSAKEILDAAELHYQAMLAIVDAESSGRDLSNILDTGVVCERLIALAWISGVLADSANWDAVVQWAENGCANAS